MVEGSWCERLEFGALEEVVEAIHEVRWLEDGRMFKSIRKEDLWDSAAFSDHVSTYEIPRVWNYTSVLFSKQLLLL